MLSREALIVFIEQVGTVLLSLLGVKLLTNLLGPAEFGMLALANTIVVFISTNFLFGPLGQGISRFWAIYNEKKKLELFYFVTEQLGRHAITIGVLLSAFVVVVIHIFYGNEWAFLFCMCLLTGILTGWLGLRTAVLTASRKRINVAFLNLSNAITKPALAVTFILYVGEDALWAMIGYFCSSLLVVLCAEYYYKKLVGTLPLINNKKDNDKVHYARKTIIAYSWPFVIWGVFNWVHLSCDRWALQSFYGSEVVGGFAVVAQLATFPLVFGSGFLTTLLTPIAFQKAGDISSRDDFLVANKVLVLMTSGYIAGSILVISLYYFFHYPILLLISNATFAKFSYLLPWLTAGWSFFYFGQILVNFGLLVNKPQVYVYPKIFAAIIAGACSFYFAKKMGAEGVVFGLSLAAIFYALLCLVIAVIVIKNKMRSLECNI